MHESEKSKWSHSVVSDLSRPHGLQPTRLLRPWDFSRQKYWSGVPLPSPNRPLRKMKRKWRFFATPWTVAYQAPPSMGFSRQEYWSGVPFLITPTAHAGWENACHLGNPSSLSTTPTPGWLSPRPREDLASPPLVSQFLDTGSMPLWRLQVSHN